MTNSYLPPESNPETITVATSQLGMARKLSAGFGWRWIKDAFNLYMQSPLIWIAIMLVWLVIVIGLSALPFLSIIMYVLGPILTGGMMLGCLALDQNENLTVSHLFKGFKHNSAQLAALGIIELIGFVLVFIVAALPFIILGSASTMDFMNLFNPETIPDESFIILIMMYFLLVLALEIPIIMGIWFAPSLIAIHDIKAWAAFKLSFRACLSNLIPFLIYGLILLVFSFIAMIPVGLGMLVLLPVIMISMYTGYKTIFLHDTSD